MDDIDARLVELFLQDIERWDPLLVSLIRRDEIDPWSVDIQRLSTAYLASIRTPDFRKHGRTILTLAILLKLKSEELDVDEFWGEEDAADEGLEEGCVDVERAPRPVPRLVPIRARAMERRVTLGELVNALRAVMDQRHSRAERHHAGEGEASRLEVKAELDIGRLVDHVYQRIIELCESAGTARFSELAGTRRDEAVWSLICLLHLYFENTIGLEQEAWWGEILITQEDRNGVVTGVAHG